MHAYMQFRSHLSSSHRDLYRLYFCMAFVFAVLDNAQWTIQKKSSYPFINTIASCILNLHLLRRKRMLIQKFIFQSSQLLTSYVKHACTHMRATKKEEGAEREICENIYIHSYYNFYSFTDIYIKISYTVNITQRYITLNNEMFLHLQHDLRAIRLEPERKSLIVSRERWKRNTRL